MSEDLTDDQISRAPDAELEQWATNETNQANRRRIVIELGRRKADRSDRPRSEAASGVRPTGPAPFDPRVEISADAKHVANRIVSTMWTIFVLLPLLALALVAFLKYLT